MNRHIDVIATTISGSIKDWGKVKRIKELFLQHGEEDVDVVSVDSHSEARRKTCELAKAGSRLLISAGGSGTFNSVVEGCYEAEINLEDLRLGFLRKGSADLIGKTLGMPDEIEEAVAVFVQSIREDRVTPCDVLQATDGSGRAKPRRFVGYGGAEIFGDIPRYTENRFIKYYKGVLSQLFGDLGPFFVGTNLAIAGKLLRRLWKRRRRWEIVVDGEPAAEGLYQAMIIVNGDLGKDLPFAKSEPLGSGDFHFFTIRDLGYLKLFPQLKRAFDSSIMDDPERWGFASFRVEKKLEIKPHSKGSFPLNTDGSTMTCQGSASIEIVDQIRLLSR